MDDDEPTFEGESTEQLRFFDDEEEDEHKEISLEPKQDVTINVTDCRKEKGDWLYDIEVIINGKKHLLQRKYKDVQWLHRALMRNVDLGAYVIPPLPLIPSSITDLPATPIIGKGDAMFGGLNRRHTLRMEMFLQALANHHFFIENHLVYNFLTEEQVSDHERLGAGTMWSQITKVYSNFSLSGLQDTDEKFDAFLKYVSETGPNLEATYLAFSEYIFSWQKLGSAYVSVKAGLQDLATTDKEHTDISHIESQMTEAILDVGINECLLSLDAALSLATALSYQADHFVHCKEMLLRRLALLQAFLTATAQLDKAKPEKKNAAEKTKSKAESQFQAISRTAETEITVFTDHYHTHLKKGLLSYTEAQIAHSKRTLETLTHIKESIVNTSTPNEE